jgi:2-polyprenyl-6-methoxyphenol hydroxylase-like FAD-dependent oxidoreductase
MIGVLPIGRLPGEQTELAAFFWSLRTDGYEAWRNVGVDAWRRRVCAIWPEVEPLTAALGHIEDLTFATYSDLTMRRTFGDRLIVIGDAAHCTSPQLGQGANLGLVDAMLLARCLDSAASLGEALASHAEARRRHVRFYQLASRWLTPFFQSDSRVAATLRDVAFGPMGRLPFLRGQMLATLAGIKTGALTRLDPGDWHPDYGRRVVLGAQRPARGQPA